MRNPHCCEPGGERRLTGACHRRCHTEIELAALQLGHKRDADIVPDIGRDFGQSEQISCHVELRHPFDLEPDSDLAG